jgi:[ribosomal protein S5]-alanine N-acetyltransferase
MLEPYEKCPEFETEHFALRLVRIEDAEDLLRCYSDPKSQEILNADQAVRDFRHQSLEEMKEWICFWLREYEQQMYVRFTITDKSIDGAVGTIEMFDATKHLAGCDALGVLRLDLASQYEQQPYIKELLELCIATFYRLFDVKLIVILAIPAVKERISALRALGFEPFDWPNAEREHYWVHRTE